MMVEYQPSPEMVEAGACAMYDADALYECVWSRNREDVRERYRKMSTAALSAAMSVIVQEPCSTCGHVALPHRAGDVVTLACPDHKPGAPSWAWLRPAQEAGIVERFEYRPEMYAYEIIGPTREAGEQ